MGVTDDQRPTVLDATCQADVSRLQRYALAAELLRERQVVVVGDPAGDGRELLRRRGCDRLLAQAAPPWSAAPQTRGAIVSLDGAGPLEPGRLFDELAAAAAVGDLAIVVSLRGAADPVAAEQDAGAVQHEDALALTGRLPGAVLLVQTVAEGSLLRRVDRGVETFETAEAELELPDGLDPEDAAHYVWVVGLDDELAAAGARATLKLTVTPAATRRVRLLEAANAALLRTNARLGRELPGRGGAAATGELARLQRTVDAAAADAEQARAAAAEAEHRRVEAERRSDALGDRAAQAERLAEQHAARAVSAEARVVEVELRAHAGERRVAEVEARAQEAERWALGLEERLAVANDRRAVRAANRLSRLLRR
ncbi:hypothetical protein [Conexibacter woesei]|uniref:Uncharacterized protein n=1 Tax=Conexibacter woesei (strain DSM 14684 / CCUG 47730 / CIP 108061 / JCM 11494 / NBRC 100937 / ID131577) TaxID=469383 RepID=D3EZP7_CONWI|nr:hypothetical protein [Conexibacter woesei]ADB53885.1 hypothetical protein Cwoe_5480 [Conexibacter woesei DSM 14684]